MGNNEGKLWRRIDDPSSMMDGGVCIPINDHEIMLATLYRTKKEQDGIIPGFYIFDCITNKWNLWMKYSGNLHLPSKTGVIIGKQLVLDKLRNELFLWCRDYPDRILTVIDIKTKRITKKFYLRNHNHFPNIVKSKDDVHLIQGKNHLTHGTIDRDIKSYQDIIVSDHPLRIRRKDWTLFAYIQSKNAVLIISVITADSTNSIFEYSLDTQNGRALTGMDYKYGGGHLVVTNDEKHIIIFPAHNARYSTKRNKTVICIIDILDNGNYNLRESKIKLPNNTLVHSTMIGITEDGNSELLIFGYIRRVCKDYAMNDIPLEIKRIIVEQSKSQILHGRITTLSDSARITCTQMLYFHHFSQK